MSRASRSPSGLRTGSCPTEQASGVGSSWRKWQGTVWSIAQEQTVKKSLPEELRKKPEASFLSAFVSASFATTMCYPLDTARRQMQMKGSLFNSFLDTNPGIVARDGFHGLYRGFGPNVLKNLPNSSIRLTTFDAAKNLITASQAEYQRVLEEHQKSFTSS
nr:thylakoid ADP,ATP carrier protein, chloroplastic-like [Physcomitrium patens]|eukprot:XP_024358616.1 thylakoid ADP,ATP carrier protein, chloroplastic-like [Physcomitrella patens]